jgi:hypothetical protein
MADRVWQMTAAVAGDLSCTLGSDACSIGSKAFCLSAAAVLRRTCRSSGTTGSASALVAAALRLAEGLGLEVCIVLAIAADAMQHRCPADAIDLRCTPPLYKVSTCLYMHCSACALHSSRQPKSRGISLILVC